MSGALKISRPDSRVIRVILAYWRKSSQNIWNAHCIVLSKGGICELVRRSETAMARSGKLFVFIWILTAFAVGAGGYHYPPSLGRQASTVVDEGYNGKAICLRRGEILEVRLKAQFGTGYRWELTRPAARLKLIGQSVENSTPGEETAHETQIFRFEARSAGAFNMRFDHIRPWEKGVDPLKTFSISGRIVRRSAK